GLGLLPLVVAVGGEQGAAGGMPGGGGELSAQDGVLLEITGGTLVVDAEGDGLDSNGSITMSGGTVVVAGPTSSGNGALDYNGTFGISGGELLAVGASGMAQTPSDGSTQSFVGLTLDGTQQAGTVVHVAAEDGTVLASFTAPKSFSSVVYSSPDVTDGATYTALTGGSTSTPDTTGLSHDGDASSATTSATATAGEVQAGMGGGPGGGGRPSRP
ncbi:carbohydrate-binding domain-containing protein, partial [Cellulomonas septica]|nr:carbohydrate-binding domain-containing protein [Cellulomonas septica]